MSHISNRNILVAGIGLWITVLTTILTVWFAVAFGLYQPTFHVPWQGMQIYAETFHHRQFLAWIIPCLLLTVTYLTMITCLYYLTAPEKKIYALLALVFAICYTAILSATYYIQLVVVDYNLLNHSTEGLSLWLFAHPYPHSIPGACEGIGYGFMSLSLILASRTFSGNRLSTLLSTTFLLSGMTGLIVFTDPIFPLPLAVTLFVAVANALLLITGFIILCFWFRQKKELYRVV